MDTGLEARGEQPLEGGWRGPSFPFVHCDTGYSCRFVMYLNSPYTVSSTHFVDSYSGSHSARHCCCKHLVIKLHILPHTHTQAPTKILALVGLSSGVANSGYLDRTHYVPGTFQTQLI